MKYTLIGLKLNSKGSDSIFKILNKHPHAQPQRSKNYFQRPKIDNQSKKWTSRSSKSTTSGLKSNPRGLKLTPKNLWGPQSTPWCLIFTARGRKLIPKAARGSSFPRTDEPYSSAMQCSASLDIDSQSTQIDTQRPKFHSVGQDQLSEREKSSLQPSKSNLSKPKWTQEGTKSTPRKLNRILDVKIRLAEVSN